MATEVAQKSSLVDNTDIVSLQVSLPQLLDLALGTPEIGAVNFNILHNFLQVLLHQIDLQTTKVEYRGESAKRIKTMVASLKPGPSLRLQEYSITDSAGKISQQIPKTDSTSVDVLMAVEDDLKVTKGVKKQVSPEKNAEVETLIFVEPVVDGSTPTALAFKQLEQSVRELQHQFQALKDLSTTPEIMERLKRRMTDPVTDMWQFININKRLEANEQGIDKLTTMLQDVMKDDVSVAAIADIPSFKERLNELENKVAKMEQEFGNIRAILDILIKKPKAAMEIAETDETIVLSREKEETTEEIRETATEVIAARRVNADTADIVEIRHDVATPEIVTVQIQREPQDLNQNVAQIETTTTTVVKQTVDTESPDTAEKIDITERPRIDEICGDIMLRLEAIEATYSKALSDITERLDKLEKEVGDLLEKVDSMQATDKADDINELVAKIQKIQTDMERLGQTADKLLNDKEIRETHLNTLLEQIEILKTIKADKEDLEDALADKADAQAMRKKVSHDQFHAACDDLTRGLMEAVDKLNKQESIWQQALDEIQNEIASKVDKIEMTPLKDLVDTRLKSLQEKLRSMAEVKRESEAAGTKKMLRDVQCISCDKDVVMKTKEVCGFHPEPLPPTDSMRPYLTYKLNQIRKQRRLPHSRNMIQFEAAIRETKRIKTMKEEAYTRTPRDHLCNRYCGGSHTVTTPQQRVLRTGHFLTQWGPEVMQLSEGLIRGNDGQMYRGCLVTCKRETCDSICWESQIKDETWNQTPQERIPSTSAPRKSLPSRRSSVASRKRESRKLSKEPEITEPSIQQIEEVRRVTSPKEINDYSLITPTGPQDEIIYETNAAAE